MANTERHWKWQKSRKFVAVGEKIAVSITRPAKEFDLDEDPIARELLRFAD